jgi:hypothetical protein
MVPSGLLSKNCCGQPWPNCLASLQGCIEQNCYLRLSAKFVETLTLLAESPVVDGL